MCLMSKKELKNLLKEEKAKLNFYFDKAEDLLRDYDEALEQIEQLSKSTNELEDKISENEKIVSRINERIQEVEQKIKSGEYVDYSYAELEKLGQMTLNYE